ncbi:Unknown protein [Striga hermonthica]|uniref:Uncharacterized protein n=1 Tax=Striga hermonthica TaxID=68872 RepID=A0A9N7NC76_STRHE|nr:Unknown protein [Striga hermonthica]
MAAQGAIKRKVYELKRADECSKRANLSSLPENDDFVDVAPQLKRSATLALEATGVAPIIGSDDGDALPSINTRSSPAIFVKVVSGLTDDQKQAVRDMGFGRLLELTITMTPAKMGHWLVENFNHMDRKLKLYGGEKIHVKEDDVYVVLGLPRGTIEITNKKKKTESELLKEWVRLYNVSKPANITAMRVLDMIQNCDRSDDWFKRNFVVLMVTCLFESTSNGMANLRIIHLLSDLSNVMNMNWCSYMIRCLVCTKKSWNDNRGRKNFTGPLLFLTEFVQEFASKTRILATIGVEILKLVENAPKDLLDDDNFLKMQGAAQKLLGVCNEDSKGTASQRATVATPTQYAQPQLTNDAFWNNPENLAAIDAIIEAVARRDHFIKMKMHDEGPSYSLGLGLTQDEDNVDEGRHNNADEPTIGGPSNVDVPPVDCGAAMNAVAGDTGVECVGDETGLTEKFVRDDGHAVALSIPEVVSLEWSEDFDDADAGVITMRLMETFKGRITKNWNQDMKKVDKGQLKLMRKRYCYVIACAPNNDAKDANLVAARKFQELYEGVKTPVVS